MTLAAPMYVPGAGGGGVVGPTEVIRYTGTAPLKGQWVCMATGIDSSKVVLATDANLKKAGVTRGLAVADASGGIVSIADDTAVCSASITGLSSRGLVGIDPVTARSVILTGTQQSGAECVGGNADDDGAVTVKQLARVASASSTASIKSYPLEYSPKAYGAKCDGQFNAQGLFSGTDDTPAWNAMITAYLADPLRGKKKIRLSPGLMYLAGDPWAHGVFKVEIPTPCHIEGNGGMGLFGYSVPGNSGILLPPLCQLVYCNAGARTVNPGTEQAEFCHTEYLNIRTQAPIIANNSPAAIYSFLGVTTHTRQAYITAGKGVPKGACVVKNNATVSVDGGSGTSKTDGSGTNNTVMFRANVAFTPSGADPALFGTATNANIGTVVADGSGSWTIESVPKDRGLFSGTTPVVGQRFCIPGDVRYIYEVVTAGGNLAGTDTGTCDASTTGFMGHGSGYIQPSPWRNFSDGACTIRPIATGVILNLGNENKFQHIAVEGGIGPLGQTEGGSLDGVATSGDPNWAVADYSAWEDIRGWQVYGGLSFHGAECNLGAAQHVRVDCPGLIQRTLANPAAYPSEPLGDMGDGSFLTHDRHLGGNSYFDGFYESGNGVPIVSDSSAGSTRPGLPDCTQPGSQSQYMRWAGEGPPSTIKNIINLNAFYNTTEEQIAVDERCACMQVGPDRVRNLFGNETASSKKVNFYIQQVLGASVASYEIQAGQDITKSQRTAFWVDKVGTLTFGTGWITYGQGPQTGTLGMPRVAWGETYGDAKNTGSGPGPGIGLFCIPDGYFNRTVNGSTAGVFYGTDPAMLTDTRLRYGKRLVGDSFPVPGGTEAAGDFKRCQVTVTGFRAPKWTNTTVYVAEDDAAYQVEATCVEPTTNPTVYSVNGTHYSFRLTTLVAQSGGVEPIWNFAAATFVDAVGNTWTKQSCPTVVPYDIIWSSTNTLSLAAAEASFTLKQADKTTNAGTGAALTVQAQNETGTTSTGGQLNLDSGTGTTVAGNVDVRPGGTAQFRVTPTMNITVNKNPLVYGTGTVHASAAIRFDNTSQKILGARNSTPADVSLLTWHTDDALTIGADSSRVGQQVSTIVLSITDNNSILGVVGSATRFELTHSSGASLSSFNFFSTTDDGTIKIKDKTTNSGTGQVLTIQGQNETGTTSTGGKLALTSGTGTTAAGNVEIQTGGTCRELVTPSGIQLFNAATADFGGGAGVLGLHNATTDPTTNPTNGAIIYASGGAAKVRGSGGTVTTFGPSDPHCPKCGADFMTEHESDKYGYLAVCLKCMADEIGERSWILRKKPV